MQNLQLGWQPAAALSLGLAAGAVVSAYRGGRAARLAPYLRESALVAALYSLWQVAASGSLLGPAGALARGLRIAQWERGWLPLPSERTVQRLITGHPLLAQGANWYYAAMHFTALGGLLLWLFARHRERYPRVRNVLVALTASSLLIQLVPVAPPRLLPQLGFVDTAAQYGQSVYNIGGISVDQLSAMPSVHVGWALLVAWAVLTVGSGKHRWWVLLHPLLTCFVVVATANHFWLDGIVAALLLAGSIAGVELSGRRFRFDQVGTDDRDAGPARGGHAGKRLAGAGERDPAGDELVGPQRA
jgi:hypothetical protein